MRTDPYIYIERVLGTVPFLHQVCQVSLILTVNVEAQLLARHRVTSVRVCIKHVV